jgi:diaminopimelate epimerase
VRPARDGLPPDWTTVAMGPVQLAAEQGPAGLRVTLGAVSWPARAADVGNPHAVVVLSAAQLAALGPVGTLPTPTAAPADTFPDGFNLELLTVTGPAAVAVRIVERGVGETLACGTGVCAAVAVAGAAGLLVPAAVAAGVTVTVPGGTLDVRLTGSAPLFADAELSGPAEVVATGTALLA